MREQPRNKREKLKFRKGDIVEWDDRIHHEGEVLGRASKYKTIQDSNGILTVVSSLRANYFRVKDSVTGNEETIYGSRLTRTKVKVEFN